METDETEVDSGLARDPARAGPGKAVLAKKLYARFNKRLFGGIAADPPFVALFWRWGGGVTCSYINIL